MNSRSLYTEAAEKAGDLVAVLVDYSAEQEATGADLATLAPATARVIDALKSLGFRPVELSLKADDPGDWLARLIDGDFRLAFNLCESLDGHADGEHLPAAAVELLDLPMTGARASTLLYCLDKDRCAAMLHAHGVPVPHWQLVAEDDPAPSDWSIYPAIVKPAAEDASNGVHANSVVRSHQELAPAVESLREHWDKIVIQEFIDGREINIAIVGDHVLPPSEIDFSTLPEDSPPIISFEAKWMTGSPEDRGTRPVCPAPLDPGVVRRIKLVASRAWALMDGVGYARVDVRLSRDGVPFVIDMNPNPDLSPDAGLARQALAAGWSYEDLIRRIVDDALSRRRNGSDGSGERNAATDAMEVGSSAPSAPSVPGPSGPTGPEGEQRA